MTNSKTTFYRKEARLASGRKDRLRKKYPGFDFDFAIRIVQQIKKYADADIAEALNNYQADRCKVNVAKTQCSNCDCWKSKITNNFQ